jgi:hypothetical protein
MVAHAKYKAIFEQDLYNLSFLSPPHIHAIIFLPTFVGIGAAHFPKTFKE